ncbi:MAG: excisionase [Mycobacterium sp.]|nr:excisionase [Mycobacterium sp.]
MAALHAGKAVTIAPRSMTLTTQRAADLLGVSRPTVVCLINDGELAAERVGNRHRLVLDDVLAYGRPADSASTTSSPRPRWTSTPTRIPT